MFVRDPYVVCSAKATNQENSEDEEERAKEIRFLGKILNAGQRLKTLEILDGRIDELEDKERERGRGRSRQRRNSEECL